MAEPRIRASVDQKEGWEVFLMYKSLKFLSYYNFCVEALCYSSRSIFLSFPTGCVFLTLIFSPILFGGEKEAAWSILFE